MDKELENRNILIRYANERLSSLDACTKHEDRSYPVPFFADCFNDSPTNEKEIKAILGKKWMHNLTIVGSFFQTYQYITRNFTKDREESAMSASQNLNIPSQYMNNKTTNLISSSGLDGGPLSNTLDEHISNRLGNSSLVLIDHFKDTTVPVLYLSTHGHRLLEIYGSRPMSVSRALHKLQDIKGLVLVDDSYHFGEKDSHPRAYAYNKSVEKLVMGMVRKYHVPLLRRQLTITPMPASRISNTRPDIFSRIKISSHITGLPVGVPISDEMCQAVLWEKYGPLLDSRLRKMYDMNLMLPEEEKTSCHWNIHRSANGVISKIGMRASSRISSFTKDKISKQDVELGFANNSRPHYLDERFGEGNHFNYDVHGSIFQMTRLLNHGIWHGNAIDPYPMMFGYELTSAERNIFKSICMPLYFDRSAKEVVNHNRKRTTETLRRYNEDKIEAVISDARTRMLSFTGEPLDSEIFFHESMVYLDFVWELRQQGISVVQVYDGFYLAKGSIRKSELEALLKRTALLYRKEYVTWQEWLGKLLALNSITGP